ncbi:EthD family reductase, partial [Acidovorax sp. SRB_24]|uniref:EthD family reductase n=1 Tax=Acidovorax sp. SRB_24 TaxID=1962700 RepID=UPI00145E2BAD
GPVATPQGDSSYHLVVTLTFDSMHALEAALASEEGQRTAADLTNFADGGAELLIINQRSL